MEGEVRKLAEIPTWCFFLKYLWIFLGCGRLVWAVRNGHGRVVKILLWREDVNPGKLDNNGQTTLSIARYQERP